MNHNYANNPAMNFDIFINQLQETMISELIKLNSRLGDKVIDPLTIKEVLLAENAS